MKRKAFVIFSGAMALLGSGCRTGGQPGSRCPAAVPVENVAVVEEVGSMVTPPPVTMAGARHPHAVVTSAVTEPVRVLIRTVSDGGDAAQVTKLLGGRLQAALAAGGYRVVSEGAAEIVANIGVTCAPVAADGKGGFKSTVDAAVARSPDLNDFVEARKTEHLVKGRFVTTGSADLAGAEVVQVLADRLSSQVPAWLAGACKAVGGNLEICVVALSNARFADSHTDYTTYFVQHLRSLEGLYDCKVLAADKGAGTLQARVVYDRVRFPGGLVGRLYRMPELNIHP